MLCQKTSEKYYKDCVLKRAKQGSHSIGIWACMPFEGVGFFTCLMAD